MEESYFKDCVQLSKGINLKELLNGPSEFHIDIDFKEKGRLSCKELFSDSDDDSDIENVLKNIEKSTEKMVLSCPEYLSFCDLASKMVDSIPSGEVKMLIIEEGDGPLVPVDAMVTLHYAAYFEKEKIPFDCTLNINNGAPFRMQLGIGRFLPGLEVGLTAVKGPQARFHLLLQPSVAWGSKGVPPRIRPEPALFVIKLYQVEDIQAGARFNDLPTYEQKKFHVAIKTVTSLHANAKHLFTKKRYTKAIKTYQQCLSILIITQIENELEANEIKQLKVKTYTNLAVCYYKIKKPKYVMNMCENLDYITDMEKNCKALFYYGRAQEMLGKHEEAFIYYKKALKLEPKNIEIGNALANLDEYNLKCAENEKTLWQNAFQCEPEKKKVIYAVDGDFQAATLHMCETMAAREGYSKFDLPNSLTKDEIDCVKELCSNYEQLSVIEDGDGTKKKVSVVKKSLS